MRDIQTEDRNGSVERVSMEVVVRQWAKQQLDGVDDDDLESRSLEEMIASFEERRELAESIFLEEDLEWYRLRLTEEELRNLLVVKGPEDEGWRAVADGNDVESIAERIVGVDDVESLHENVPKDVLDVREMAEEFRSGEEAGAFIAVQESLDEHAYLADGNHRAVAIVHHVLTGGSYEDQLAYVGVPPEEESATLEEDENADDHPAA